ncbi:hypothetical protein CXB51_033833 [Gossypium anomalum]|uniref:RNase H type-1 domain-containing protein n=1 Tax=Gossypium anomalum TaxID=47600 RepID=A0A8J6CGP0_9ROSI|nr:hypothetical protein CXB51_033833 [Gossypium anomalum]
MSNYHIGISDLIVELDALIVARLLNRPYMEDDPMSTYVRDCLPMTGEGWVVEIRHIFREGNICANHLASLAQAQTILREGKFYLNFGNVCA